MADIENAELTGQVETPAEPEVTAPAATETPGANEPEDEATKHSSRFQERIQGLIEKGKAKDQAHEQMVAQLKAELEAAAKPPVKPTADKDNPLAGHPALRGETPDEQGEVYVNGKWHRAYDLVHQYEIAELKKAREGDQEAGKQAELDADEAKRQQGVVDAVEDEVATVVKASLPLVKDETILGAVREIVLSKAQGPISEAYHAKRSDFGAYSAQLIQQAYEETKKLFGLFGALQLQDNEKEAQIHKVKPGTPGDKAPKSRDQMTLQEREAEAIARAAAIDAGRRG